MQDRADKLISEADDINDKRLMITKLSNVALQLYSWYIKYGHARDEEDEKGVKKFFKENLPRNAFEQKGFYERLYLYQSLTWFAFIRQDFLMYYRYAKKWTDLFEEEKNMISIEPSHYIKGMHNLLNSHFYLRNYPEFFIALKKFERFAESEIANEHDNNRVQTFVYLFNAKANRHIMLGSFNEGLALIPQIEEKLKKNELYLDRHRILVFNYKIAILYFGAAEYEKSIDYLRKIINDTVDLRTDLQCYARLLHLLCHYELGNTEIIEHLIKSVYRFMAKMKKLSVVEEEMFKFLRNSFHVSANKLKPEFEKFLQKIKQLEKNRFETRSFSYIDIISWVESKVYEKPLSRIIKDKYVRTKRWAQASAIKTKAA